MDEKRRRWTVAAVVLVAALAIVPRHVCSRDVDGYYDGRSPEVRALASHVAKALDAGARPSAHHTGSVHMDGEWAYVSVMMSVIGLTRAAYGDRSFERAARERGSALLASEGLLGFGTRAWGHHYRDAEVGHAYLGWGALALGHARELDPGFPEAAAHDAMIALLRRSLDESPHGVFETFPSVTFPPDVAVAIGAVALHDRLTGGHHDVLVKRAVKRFIDGFVDPKSGFVWQQADPTTGAGRDTPRGSGTAISAYALSFADDAAAAKLRAALHAYTSRLAGFEAVREYGDGRFGLGDIDSGPVLLGVSVAATGFSLASARQACDRDWFRGLARTMHMFGVPWRDGGDARYLTGGALGNAVLLAMLTAEPSKGACPKR